MLGLGEKLLEAGMCCPRGVSSGGKCPLKGKCGHTDLQVDGEGLSDPGGDLLNSELKTFLESSAFESKGSLQNSGGREFFFTKSSSICNCVIASFFGW